MPLFFQEHSATNGSLQAWENIARRNNGMLTAGPIDHENSQHTSGVGGFCKKPVTPGAVGCKGRSIQAC